MDYKLIDRSDYAGKLSDQKTHIQIRYYTKRQIKAIYPHENFSIVGEIGNKTGIQCSTAEDLAGQPLPVYKEKTHNNLTESIIGYTVVDNHTYLAVVKNILIVRIFFLALVFAFIGLCITIWMTY